MNEILRECLKFLIHNKKNKSKTAILMKTLQINIIYKHDSLYVML